MKNLDDPRLLDEKLGHRFRNVAHLAEALRHSSYVNEQVDPDLKNNERLEFLGDAVLNLSISHVLMERFPDVQEGELSRMRAALVNESRLARIARKIELADHILLGRGEIQTGGREKNSILANTLEALIAAIYLDAGFEQVFKWVERHFEDALTSVATGGSDQDFKSRLQERVQMHSRETPVYVTIMESGPDHDKTFRVRLELTGLKTEGTGKSKKAAEQSAARKALMVLNAENPGDAASGDAKPELA